MSESHSINAHGACARGLVTADGATVARIAPPQAALAALARELARQVEKARTS